MLSQLSEKNASSLQKVKSKAHHFRALRRFQSFNHECTNVSAFPLSAGVGHDYDMATSKFALFEMVLLGIDHLI